jgi:hypothetical protein
VFQRHHEGYEQVLQPSEKGHVSAPWFKSLSNLLADRSEHNPAFSQHIFSSIEKIVPKMGVPITCAACARPGACWDGPPDDPGLASGPDLNL